jgi:uncharacterized protein YbjT (DUF2867 family)
MVTGASGLLGRAVVEAMARRGEVRAVVRREEAAPALRALGAKVAVRDLSEPDDLIEILSRVHTVVHLVGGMNPPTEEELFAANHGSALTVVRAAKEEGVPRLILLSAPGASPDAQHPYLRAKGLAEEAVIESGLEHAVMRTTHAYGVGGFWFTATVVATEHGFVVGDGRQRLAPVFADDVGAVVAAIDDRRDHLAGTWGLAGPDELNGDELFGLLGEAEEPDHLEPPAAAARLTELLGVPVSVRAAELLAAASVADAPDAVAAFDVRRTPLAQGLALTAERTAKIG